MDAGRAHVCGTMIYGAHKSFMLAYPNAVTEYSQCVDLKSKEGQSQSLDKMQQVLGALKTALGDLKKG